MKKFSGYIVLIENKYPLTLIGGCLYHAGDRSPATVFPDRKSASAAVQKSEAYAKKHNYGWVSEIFTILGVHNV